MAPIAHAEPTSAEKAAATVLFREARELMEHGDVPGACRRFEESQRLDPLPGTLLNMAVCHEKEGRTATAWVEFRDAAALARRDGRGDRVTLAEEHEKGLERRLLRLRVVVPAPADLPKLAITLDGTDLARIAWDTPLPLDPGDHAVIVSAPAKAARTVHVTLSGEGTTQVVTVDPLEDAPSPLATSPAPVASSPTTPPPAAPPETTRTALANTAPELPAQSAGGGLGTRREVALVLGGVAVVGLATGTYFGLDAFSKHNESNAQCPAANQCSALGVTYNNDSMTSADRSTVAFGASIAVLGVATYLWLSGGDRKPPRATAVSVMPRGGRDGGGLTLVGTF